LLNLRALIPYGGDLPFLSEEEVIDFVASEKLGFLSNKKLKKHIMVLFLRMLM